MPTLVEAWEKMTFNPSTRIYPAWTTDDHFHDSIENWLREQDVRIEAEKREDVRAEVLKVLDEILSGGRFEEMIPMEIDEIRARYEKEKP